MFEFALLGLLHEAPMHGYELRKRLHDLLGAFRAFSYGSLYPTLRRLQRAGLIVEEGPEESALSWGRRARKVYKLTPEGKERFADLLANAGPQTWDDDSFGVHLAFFSRTEGLRERLAKTGEQIDRYTRELHRQGLESTEREVRWLNELIAHEQSEQDE